MAPKIETKKQEAGQNVPTPKRNNVALWVLIGCLGMFLIAGITVLGIIIWGGWQVKKRIDQARPEIQKWQETADEMKQRVDKFGEGMETISEQMEALGESIPQAPEEPVGSEARAVGFVRSVYEKSGKRYLEIDYIEWLTGEEAQKAMREDGACPSRGECMVPNDYYIRNRNPMLRTFEISSQAKIFSQTLGMKETGSIWDKEISFSTFKNLFNSGTEWELQNNPYAIELSSGIISKITQYYIP